jgi:MFS family permease
MYWVSSTFAMAASNILQFVLALYVLDMTHSATTFATILSVVIVPRIIGAPISGVWADRYNRVQLMAGINLASASFLGLFALVHLMVLPLSVPMVFVLVILLELSEVMYSAPSATIIPAVVAQDELAEATSLSSIDDGIVQILGPVVAAIAYDAMGVAGGLLGACIFNLMACFTIRAVRTSGGQNKSPEGETQKTDNTEKTGALAQFSEGVRLVRGDAFLRRLVILAPLLNFFLTSVFTVTLVYLLREELSISTSNYALYNVLCGVMGIVVPILSIPYMKRKSEGSIIQGSMAVLAVLVLSLSIAMLPWLRQGLGNMVLLVISTAIAVFMSALLILMNIATTVVFKTKVKLDYIGRVSSIINLLATVSVPLGQLLFGYLADLCAVSVSFFLSATGMFWVFLIARKMFSVQSSS